MTFRALLEDEIFNHQGFTIVPRTQHGAPWFVRSQHNKQPTFINK
jgi:hypothetical protein